MTRPPSTAGSRRSPTGASLYVPEAGAEEPPSRAQQRERGLWAIRVVELQRKTIKAAIKTRRVIWVEEVCPKLNQDCILGWRKAGLNYTNPVSDVAVSYWTLSPILVRVLHSRSEAHPNVHTLVLEFPKVDGLPAGCESTECLPSMDLYFTFLLATKQLRQTFQKLLQSLSNHQDLPICVISDFFFGWTLEVCRELHVPSLVFHGMGAFSMATCKYLCLHAPHKRVNSGAGETFTVLGIPLQLTLEDLPDAIKVWDDPCDPFCQFLMEAVEGDVNSWGVLVNSFTGLEADFVAPLESFYEGEAKAWCVGPLCLYNHEVEKSDTKTSSQMCIKWLDQHTKGARSVIYASFGTQVQLSQAQLDEIGLGLEMSGHQFVWVVRSDGWEPPEGLEERLVNGRGLIVKGWIDQRAILAHEATGGFLSHCGWNSVLESLSAGVPLLAWPMIAEQTLNAKLVVELLKAGERIPNGGDGAVVGREIICKKIRDLMGGDRGKVAQELSRLANQAVHDGGASDACLTRLIDELVAPAM